MKKKKLFIYGTLFFIFTLLFFLYLWIANQSLTKANQQRMEDKIQVCALQIQQRLSYQSKDLQLISNYNMLGQSDQIPVLLEELEKTGYADGYYIIDSQGGFHGIQGEKKGIRLDKETLEHARSSGSSITDIPSQTAGLPDICLVIPLNPKSQLYFGHVMTAEDFLKTLAGDLPLSTQNTVLFDGWGNILSTYQDDLSPDIYQSLANGAYLFTGTSSPGGFEKIGSSQGYNMYIPILQPQGFMIGVREDYGLYQSSIPGLHATTLVILISLVVILLIIILLDVINDMDKKKETLVLSNLDHLTGLYNSFGLRERMNSYLGKNSLEGFCFVCFDLVTFSRINSMFGFSVGDNFLCIIGDAIKGLGIMEARIHADCFALIMKDSDDISTQLETLIFSAIQQKLGAEYLQVIGIKVGITPITQEKPVYQELYDNTMFALKHAKKQAASKEIVYDSALKKEVDLQKNIEINMMHALSKEEFLVYIQPQLDMPGEQCTRGETLIRWESEFMGFLPPDQFIPIFEANGFIVETDFFMLVSALDLLQTRINQGKSLITLAVNQSKVTIAFPNYYERLKAVIKQYPLVPLHYVELEITESTLENSWETIVPLIHSVKKLGFSIAMDDFGSGFSSLNTLRILPIDILKIDRAFLQESDNSFRSRIIIKNVVNMAKEMEIGVVCEGVETRTQLEFLKAIGCDIVQGFYYSKPIPIDEFITKYMDHSPLTTNLLEP